MSICSELERVKTEGLTDIFQFIKKAKSQRAGLVQEVVCSSVVDVVSDNIVIVRISTYFIMKFLQNMEKKCQNMRTLSMIHDIVCSSSFNYYICIDDH